MNIFSYSWCNNSKCKDILGRVIARADERADEDVRATRADVFVRVTRRLTYQ